VFWKWKEISIFIRVETIGLYATFNNVFSLMFKCMLEFGGMGLKELFQKLVSMGLTIIVLHEGIRHE
jgi:hypothetical protein